MATFTIVVLFVLGFLCLVSAFGTKDGFWVVFIDVCMFICCMISGIWMVMK